MEKNNLNNKLEKDSIKQLTDLKKGLASLNGMFDTALDSAFKSVDAALDPKQAIRFKAFTNKYIKLSIEGKTKEAEELKKTYSEQF